MKNWPYNVVLLTQQLIRTYPFFGQKGLENAQKIIYSILKKNEWQEVIFDKFDVHTIKDDPYYIPVSSFGHPYQDYESISKINVISVADSGRQGPTLILNGHVDVDIVDEEKAWYAPEAWKRGDLIDNKLYGRGACDMLGGLSALMLTASHFIQSNTDWNGRIIFCSVCDEEIGGNGTLRSLHTLKQLNFLTDQSFCIIAEPTENKPCHKSLGFAHLKFYFQRDPQHMGCALRVNNSIYDAIQLIENFDQDLKSTLENLFFQGNVEDFKINFGKISGGIDPAIPIPQLEVEGTLFYPDDCNLNKIIDVLSLLLKEKYSARLEKGDFGFSGASFSLNSKITSLLPKMELFPSPCDARLYKPYKIPTIIWGPGSLKQAHSVDEYIDISQLLDYCKIFYAFLKKYLTQSSE